MKEALTVLGIGFGVVFIGLVCLIGIIYLMSFIVRLVRREDMPRRKRLKTPEDYPEPIAPSFAIPISVSKNKLLAGPDRRATVAAVSAAIAEYMGTDPEGFRILSIRPVGETDSASDRRELIAAISAAIAAELDSDVSGIRIHSIKKI